jgi:hypothetical protein
MVEVVAELYGHNQHHQVELNNGLTEVKDMEVEVPLL